MTKEDLNIIWLDLFYFISYNKKEKLLNLFRGKDIRKEFLKEPKIRELLTDSEINKMALTLSDEFLKRKIEKYTADGIQMITINDARYPFLLKQIDTPPFCLYCKGNVQLLNSYCIAVVGTRKPTEYGTVVTKQYVKAFCVNDATVVSGLAGGVDTIAHKTAYEEHGKTIAVLAGGLYHIYPTWNFNLAKSLVVENLILSEVNPEIAPASFSFPIRNRIIAGLSHAVLITEAGEKSGAMHTKQYALDYNRDIFVVPGRINSEMSKGTNQILKELQGAITLDPDDVIQALGLIQTGKKNNSVQLDIIEQEILNFVQSEKHTFQEIAEKIGLSASALNIKLMEMEVNGLIMRVANNSYIMA